MYQVLVLGLREIHKNQVQVLPPWGRHIDLGIGIGKSGLYIGSGLPWSQGT